MDENVRAAVAAVGLNDADLETWFGAISSAYTSAQSDGEASSWDSLSATLRKGLTDAGRDATTIDQFMIALDNDGNAVETVRGMADEGVNALVDAYRAMVTSSGDESDPEAWYAFLAENGPRWNGTNEAWESFRDWFRYAAGEAGVATPAEDFINYVDSQQDKITAFAQYGVTIGAPADSAVATDSTPAAADTSTYPELTVGSTGAWVTYLDEMLTLAGFRPESDSVITTFDENLLARVNAFAAAAGLSANGQVDGKFWDKLIAKAMYNGTSNGGTAVAQQTTGPQGSTTSTTTTNTTTTSGGGGIGGAGGGGDDDRGRGGGGPQGHYAPATGAGQQQPTTRGNRGHRRTNARVFPDHWPDQPDE